MTSNVTGVIFDILHGSRHGVLLVAQLGLNAFAEQSDLATPINNGADHSPALKISSTVSLNARKVGELSSWLAVKWRSWYASPFKATLQEPINLSAPAGSPWQADSICDRP